METHLKDFLRTLYRDECSSLMDSVFKAYYCIFEGYADVRDEHIVDTTTLFNQRAAYNASLQGNNILSFLQRSSEQLLNKYTIDDELELDEYDTTHITSGNYGEERDIPASYYNNIDVFEDNLGLSARDIQDLGL